LEIVSELLLQMNVNISSKLLVITVN